MGGDLSNGPEICFLERIPDISLFFLQKSAMHVPTSSQKRNRALTPEDV